MRNERMPLGIKTTGTQSASGEGSFPDLAQQRVIDVLMGDGCEEHQSRGGIETDGIHLVLMLPQHLEHLGMEWHHSLLACLGGCWDEPMGGETIDSQGFVNQEFSFLPPDAIPGECPEFPVAKTRAQPQEEQGIEPSIVGLQIGEDCLDLIGREDIGMPWGLVEFQGAGEEVSAFRQDTSEFGEDANDGSVLQTLLLHPGNEEVNVLSVS